MSRTLPLDNPFRQELIGLVISINEQIPIEESNRVLIMHLMNTKEKIIQFSNWIKEHLKDGKLQTTETEIMNVVSLIE